jgi:DNA-binding NtrC family response regulator
MDPADTITGKSKHVQALRKRLAQLGGNGRSFILIGESGVGKSRIAEAFGRLDHEFMMVDASGMDEAGLREALDRCRRGTLLIEEVEESSFRAQEILTGFLAARSGSVRIILTLRSRPEDLLEKRRLLDDLYGKVLGFENVEILPLRERPEDIPLLLRELAPGMVVDINGLEILTRRLWTENIRELAGTVRTCLAASEDGVFRLPESILQEQQDVGRVLGGFLNSRGAPVESSLDDFEQSVLRHALDCCGQDLVRVAAMLGIAPAKLELRLARLGISTGSTPS